MSISLSKYAKKWVASLYFYENLPLLEDDEIDVVSYFTELAGHYLFRLDREKNRANTQQHEILPFWTVFTMPKRPAIVNLSSYLYSIKTVDEKQYQKVLDDFHFILISFIREHLFLYTITASFRKLLGLPILNQEYTPPFEEIESSIQKKILPLTTPFGILHHIAENTRSMPMSAGIALFRKIESLSYELRHSKSLTKVKERIDEYYQFIDKLSTFDYQIDEIEELDLSTVIPKLMAKHKTDPTQTGLLTDIEDEDDVGTVTQEPKPLPDFSTWEILEEVYMERADPIFIRVTHFQNNEYSVVATEKAEWDTYVTSHSHMKWFKDRCLASNYHKKIVHRRIRAGFKIQSFTPINTWIKDASFKPRYITPLTYMMDFGMFYIKNGRTDEAIPIFKDLYSDYPNSKRIQNILNRLGVDLDTDDK